MSTMWTQLWTIVRNTFTESIRQPVFTVLLLVIGLALVLNPSLSAYTFDDDNKILIDMGLSTILIGGLLLAAFTAAGVLSREISNKTVLTVISKPIGRPTFVVGKFLGVTAAIVMACWIWAVVFLLTVRHGVMSTAADAYDMPVILFGLGAAGVAFAIAVWGNYFYGWVFTSTLNIGLAAGITIAYLFVLVIGEEWQFQAVTAEFTKNIEEEGSLLQLMIAVLLVIEALVVLCAVAVAASTRLGQIMTLVICATVFFMGLGADYMFGRFADSDLLAALFYHLLPNLQPHWLADALTQRNPVGAGYIGLVSAYTALYATAVLGIAAALFQTRETG